MHYKLRYTIMKTIPTMEFKTTGCPKVMIHPVHLSFRFSDILGAVCQVMNDESIVHICHDLCLGWQTWCYCTILWNEPLCHSLYTCHKLYTCYSLYTCHYTCHVSLNSYSWHCWAELCRSAWFPCYCSHWGLHPDSLTSSHKSYPLTFQTQPEKWEIKL